MRTIQLTTIDYINDALEFGVEAALPNYTPIQFAVRRRTWQNLSHLPHQYLEEATVTPATKTPGAVSSLAAAAELPAALAATASAPAPAAAKAVRIDAPKAHQNSEWVAKYAASSKKIKDLKAIEAHPKI